MSENKPTKDIKDEKIEAEKEAEIEADISEAIVSTPIEIVPPRTDAVPTGGGRGGRFSGGAGGGKGGGRRPGGRGPRREENKDGFEEKVITIDRVTRVVKGGRRMRFRALVVVGDKKGKVGYGLGKGNEVQMAVAKAVSSAKKDLITVELGDGTIPHDIIGKSRTARVLLKSAKKDRGIIAGGAVRSVLELAGYSDIVAKSYGSNNKINSVIATIDGLKHLLKRRTFKGEVKKAIEKKDEKPAEKTAVKPVEKKEKK